MQRTERTRVLHHSSLGLHCRGCPDQISYSAGFLKGSGWRSRDEAMATKTTFHGLLRSRHCHGRWSSWPWPRPVSSSQNPSTPPKKNSMGHQEHSGARHRNRTHSNTTVYRTRQTVQDNQPTGTGSPPWASSEAEVSTGHDVESGALSRLPQEPLPIQRQKGPSTSPRRVSMDKT